jgi:hypothetical protein
MMVTGFALYACEADGGGIYTPPPEAGARRDAGVDVAPELPQLPAPERCHSKLCKTNADCECHGSLTDNVCSIGFFPEGDRYGDPICVSRCKRGTGASFADILCDGDRQGAPGVCDAPAPGTEGACLPLCELSATKIETECQGSNKCASAYFGTTNTGEVFSLGTCVGACKVDGDCKGTPGSKCQVETGLCVNAASFVTYAKTPGEACDAAASFAECNCLAVGGTGASKDRGYCSRFCLTGAAGNTLCDAAVAGWKCSAALPTVFTDGKPAFSGQPDGVVGACMRPCTIDADCDALAATIGGGVMVTCEATAGFKTCKPQP